MNRQNFEHVLAAASQVADEDELVVIGSQAILGSIPDPPPELLKSMEADVYPRWKPEKADDVDGALGDGSLFHAQFGYYAHGVGPTTATAPSGWEARLVPVEISSRPGSRRKTIALCMEVHDLVLAKLAAGRGRDWDFARVCIEHGLCDIELLLDRAETLSVPAEQATQITSWLRTC